MSQASTRKDTFLPQRQHRVEVNICTVARVATRGAQLYSKPIQVAYATVRLA